MRELEASTFCLFVDTVEARMRANTQKRTTRGAGDKRGGRGKEKTVGKRHEAICGRERDGKGCTG